MPRLWELPSTSGTMYSNSCKKRPLNYPLLIGEEDGLAAAEAFGMGMAFPFSVFVDSQNRILTVKVGELHEMRPISRSIACGTSTMAS